MKYAFVIDQRKCIGCHACTVACKAEHDVPIGVYRTWVKYIERGEFPNTQRHFIVNRCNHCDNAPCVTICPTKALYKRADGIVDFDVSRCIGCKSCMQACPYDALYIDPYSHTAAKCNYCAHRTEIGLEPACVIVCPEQAIIAGDIHDPKTEIARLIAREPVRVRKPEQGTGPNVYYLGVDEAAINPEAAREELPHMSMWSTMLKPQHEDERALDRSRSLRLSMPLRPLKEMRQAAEAHIAYDTPKNRAPWGWKVSTYLGTKSLGTGIMLVAALMVALMSPSLFAPGVADIHLLLGVLPPIIGGIFIAITLALLVADLKRPDRALFLLTKPNPTSWLVWGGYILGIFGLLQAAWFGAAILGADRLIPWLLWPVALFGIAAAGYTAFLFGQAEGRDFWQSPLLFPILIAQALLAGAAAFSLFLWITDAESRLFFDLLPMFFIAVLILHGGLVMIEAFGTHANSHVAEAARYLRGRALSWPFKGLFITAGLLLPLILLGISLVPDMPLLLINTLRGVAGILALVGLFAYEHCFVTAGQVVPLS